MNVIDRNDLTIRPEDGSQIANIAAADIVPENNRLAPATAVVAAQTCLERKRCFANTVNQAKTTIGELNQRRRIPLTRVGHRS